MIASLTDFGRSSLDSVNKEEGEKSTLEENCSKFVFLIIVIIRDFSLGTCVDGENIQTFRFLETVGVILKISLMVRTVSLQLIFGYMYSAVRCGGDGVGSIKIMVLSKNCEIFRKKHADGTGFTSDPSTANIISDFADVGESLMQISLENP